MRIERKARQDVLAGGGSSKDCVVSFVAAVNDCHMPLRYIGRLASTRSPSTPLSWPTGISSYAAARHEAAQTVRLSLLNMNRRTRDTGSLSHKSNHVNSWGESPPIDTKLMFRSRSEPASMDSLNILSECIDDDEFSVLIIFDRNDALSRLSERIGKNGNGIRVGGFGKRFNAHIFC